MSDYLHFLKKTHKYKHTFALSNMSGEILIHKLKEITQVKGTLIIRDIFCVSIIYPMLLIY